MIKSLQTLSKVSVYKHKLSSLFRKVKFNRVSKVSQFIQGKYKQNTPYKKATAIYGLKEVNKFISWNRGWTSLVWHKGDVIQVILACIEKWLN